MNIAGLDLATVSGLTTRTEAGEYKATTYRPRAKKPEKKKGFLDPKEKKDPALIADYEGQLGRDFEDFLTIYLIENKIGYVGIEAPLPSNGERTKTVIDTESTWAGKAVRKEKVAGASMSAIYRIYGLSFIAVSVCARLNIPVIFVHQATWRKDFLGNGRPTQAKKEAVKACQRMGIVVTSEDAAESVGIAYWLNNHLNPTAARVGDLFEKKPTLAQLQIKEEAEKLFKPKALVESKMK